MLVFHWIKESREGICRAIGCGLESRTSPPKRAREYRLTIRFRNRIFPRLRHTWPESAWHSAALH